MPWPAMSDNIIAQLETRLRGVVADLASARLCLKQLHWNVTGARFRELHLLLDELADTVDECTDEVSERLVTLGFPSCSDPAFLTEERGVPRTVCRLVDGQQALRSASDALAAAIQRARGELELARSADPITEDLLIQVASRLEKSLWMVRAAGTSGVGEGRVAPGSVGEWHHHDARVQAAEEGSFPASDAHSV